MAHKYFLDGFDDSTDLLLNYDSFWGDYENGTWYAFHLANVDPAGGRCGGGALDFPMGASGVSRYRDMDTVPLWVVGQAVKPTGGEFLVCLMDSATVQMRVMILPDGSVQVLRGGTSYDTGTVLGTSSPGVIPLRKWVSIEAKILIDPASGTVEIRKNGADAPILQLTGLNTRASSNSSANGFVIGSPLWGAGGGGSKRDDLYVDCGADADFRGDCRVATAFVAGAGHYQDMTPSAGSNPSCVDEHDPNDTDYVEANAADAKDTYPHSGIAVNNGATIHVVQVSPVARKKYPGVGTVAAMIRSGSTDAIGTPLTPPAGDWAKLPSQFLVDPATGVAWTVSGLNAAEIGQVVNPS